MDFRENRLFSASEVRGRFSKYEIYTVDEVRFSNQTEEKKQELINMKGQEITIYKPAEHFIVPAQDSEYLSGSYNAFDYYPDILADFIDLGENPSNQDILNFCNTYGLFNLSGLYCNLFGSSQIVDHDGDNYYAYDYDWILLSESGMRAFGDNYRSAEMMNTYDFANEIFPKSWEGYEDIISRKDIASILANNYYCEPIRYLKDEIEIHNEAFREWLDNESKNIKPAEIIDRMTGYLITNPIRMTIDYQRGWKFKWLYSSLFDALDIMFINNIIESSEQVKLCKNCNSAFIASKGSHKYCSDRCNNAARQRRFQERKRKAHQT